MAVTAIKRDESYIPYIIRMIVSDTLDVVAGAGYLTAQAANITAINEGVWSWLQSDTVLVYSNTQLAWGLYSVNPTFTTLSPISIGFAVQNGLTAHAGGGQTLGTPLHAGINQFSTVVTTADSATLPAVVLGQYVVVTNNGASTLDIYPSSGDTINSGSANAAITLAAGATITLYGNSTTNWVSH
jgi:hypothetical protein